MTFKTAQDIQATLNAGRDVERIRSANRVIVNRLFNGERPVSDGDAKAMGLKVNVNWGEGPKLAAEARRQFRKAFESGAKYFNVSLPDAPQENKGKWELEITTRLNRILKKCRKWKSLGENWRTSVVVHGIGPRIWPNREDLVPEYVAIDDLRVPTNTLTDLSNLDWFARRVWYTEGELVEKVFPEGGNMAPGWNKEAVTKLLEAIHPNNYDPTDYRWTNNPEKMAQMVRQNGGYYSSDAVMAVPIWHFYFKSDAEENDGEGWQLRCVVDQDSGNNVGDPNVFLYDDDKTQAEELDHILAMQYGDMNNVAPFLHHAVRALGFLLVEPCFWSNMNRCRFTQHVMENYNTWWKVNDPAGRSRALTVETFDRCVIPEGVSVVPSTERHQVNPQNTEFLAAQTKQLMSEASASYTAQSDSGTNKEQTAYETAIKVQQINAMMGGILINSLDQETPCYEEICRRACLKGTANKDAKSFQQAMKKVGIPDEWLDVERWDVEPVQAIGNGNPALEITSAQQLLQNKGAYAPDKQQRILNLWTGTVTNSPSLAQELAPINTQPVATDGQKWASLLFGTLMQGVPVLRNQDYSALEQIDTLIGMLGGAVHTCEVQGNMCSRQQLNGFASVSQYCQQLVQEIAADPNQIPLAKQYSQALGNLDNILKGFAQRLQEQEAAGQQDPEAQARIAIMAQGAQVKQQATEVKTQQSLAHKQASFDQQQQHRAESHAMDQQIEARQAASEQRLMALEAQLEAMITVGKAKTDIAATKAKAMADVQATKRRVETTVKEPVMA
jgi:hypothetical protein